MVDPASIEKRSESAAPARRRFLSWLWAGLAIVASGEVLWVVFAYLNPKKKRVVETTMGLQMEAGPVEAFEPNTVSAFPRGRFYLARLEDGGFLALSRSCPHLGCTLPWSEAQNRLECPCHASAFDIRGNVLRPPAPRAMALHPVVIENAVVRVDTARIIKRNRYEKGQAVYPQAT